jgi:tetratricopeptide (TPR) repeat protein
MLAKMSVEQSLMKASFYAKKGEVAEAQKLYEAVLKAFSQNKRAQQGLAALNKPKQDNAAQSLPQEVVNQLVNLYNQGQFSTVVEQAQALTEQYPEAFIVWNILGASAAQMGMLDEAIEAYKKSISL